MKRNLFAMSVLALAAQTQAQTQPPAGTTSDVRFTSTTAGDASLYPRAPGQDADKPAVFRGEQNSVDYAANAAVGRILVEVDRDAVPADGQGPVKLTVRLFDKSGQPLKGTVFATLARGCWGQSYDFGLRQPQRLDFLA